MLSNTQFNNLRQSCPPPCLRPTYATPFPPNSDLKPENLLYRSRPRLQLFPGLEHCALSKSFSVADFGLTSQKGSTGAVVDGRDGTRDFKPRETAEGRPQSSASDVFSFGKLIACAL